jgi:hypothetical protein
LEKATRWIFMFLLIFSLLLGVTQSMSLASDEPSMQWGKTYGGPNSDYAYSAIQTTARALLWEPAGKRE